MVPDLKALNREAYTRKYCNIFAPIISIVTLLHTSNRVQAIATYRSMINIRSKICLSFVLAVILLEFYHFFSLFPPLRV
jgi:hypothetical protein